MCKKVWPPANINNLLAAMRSYKLLHMPFLVPLMSCGSETGDLAALADALPAVVPSA